MSRQQPNPHQLIPAVLALALYPCQFFVLLLLLLLLLLQHQCSKGGRPPLSLQTCPCVLPTPRSLHGWCCSVVCQDSLQSEQCALRGTPQQLAHRCNANAGCTALQYLPGGRDDLGKSLGDASMAACGGGGQ
jgi:hypothetical protein